MANRDGASAAASAPPAPPQSSNTAHTVEFPDVGVISLALDRWSLRWNSRHQVLTRLARSFHVLWLNPSPEWRRAATNFQFRGRTTTPPGLASSFMVRDSSSLTPVVYHPRFVNEALLRWRLRAARDELRRRGCTKIVLYIWHVDFGDALRAVPHDLSIYHIYDEYSHAELEQAIDPEEQRLIRSVQQVITVSPTMFERKGSLNPNSVLLSNGVDFDAFATPSPEPGDIASVPRPRIGYSGFIKRQLDWQLLLALASRRSDWSFIFVGARNRHPDIADVLSRVESLPNVHFLGTKSSEELARYPQHFDVCVMPYRVNDYSKYIYPLKLHEYLASGQPIVSARLPALTSLERLVAIADGVDDWERAIQRSLQGAEMPAARSLRQEEARRHDWSTISADIARLIRLRLGEAGHQA